MENHRILVINPGSTSTKLAVFDEQKLVCEETIRHNPEELQACSSIYAQEPIRSKYIMEMLSNNGIPLSSFDAIVGRGGITQPVHSGTYEINQKMLEDLQKPKAEAHASCLGGIIAHRMGEELSIPSYVVDPVVVDERDEIASYSGLSEITRESVFHALNSKAVARLAAKKLGTSYEACNLVVAHMGGGITVGAHKMGKVIDVNDGVGGEGPFSPERTGALPLKPIIEMCYCGKYTKDDMLAKTLKGGGMVSYIGTNDLRTAEEMMKNGDVKAKKVIDAMAYQVAKGIGEMATVLFGKVDAIVLTGGLAYSEYFTSLIRERVSFISEILLFPGEDEMLALCQGGLRVLEGKEEPLQY